MTQPSIAPRKWKFALLIWCFIYPVITLLNYVFMPFMTDLAIPLRTLVLSVILVPVMAYLYIPFINRKFFAWLRR